ncbi:MAG: hypothetical protein IPP90_03565 [Gemmatimonadaceae bacterium]|nr:hypothetical protein [Gemmatimonadaceae bacterium]
MSRFFPRDVVHWGEERLHPLRAFAVRTLEPAGITGLVLRLYRALMLGLTATGSLAAFVGGLIVGALFLCGMLTWHLGNFPIKRWPMRVLAFILIEVAAELGMSSLLIGFGRERLGSRLATWADWWPMAGQTLMERGIMLTLFALVLAASVQIVRRSLDKRPPHPAHPA